MFYTSHLALMLALGPEFLNLPEPLSLPPLLLSPGDCPTTEVAPVPAPNPLLSAFVHLGLPVSPRGDIVLHAGGTKTSLPILV